MPCTLINTFQYPRSECVRIWNFISLTFMLREKETPGQQCQHVLLNCHFFHPFFCTIIYISCHLFCKVLLPSVLHLLWKRNLSRVIFWFTMRVVMGGSWKLYGIQKRHPDDAIMNKNQWKKKSGMFGFILTFKLLDNFKLNLIYFMYLSVYFILLNNNADSLAWIRCFGR